MQGNVRRFSQVRDGFWFAAGRKKSGMTRIRTISLTVTFNSCGNIDGNPSRADGISIQIKLVDTALLIKILLYEYATEIRHACKQSKICFLKIKRAMCSPSRSLLSSLSSCCVCLFVCVVLCPASLVLDMEIKLIKMQWNFNKENRRNTLFFVV